MASRDVVGCADESMRYLATLAKERRRTLIDFPDCPGCQTFVTARKSVVEVARDAVEGWLELHLEEGDVPPEPTYVPKRGARVIDVAIDPSLAVRLQIRWSRQRAGVSQGALAARIGVTRQQVSLIESRGANMQIATLQRIADALGLELDIAFRAKGARPAA
jgi:ribosome-binding protein aMBF1 (putative translation factor)